MAYNINSDTLRQHRANLLAIALRHAKQSGLNSLKRAEIAAEAKVSLGTVSNALGCRSAMINLVMAAGRAEGIELSY